MVRRSPVEIGCVGELFNVTYRARLAMRDGVVFQWRAIRALADPGCVSRARGTRSFFSNKRSLYDAGNLIGDR